MSFDWQPLILTLQLASVTTLLLLAVGVPLAWWMASTRSRLKSVAETLVSMPLILPPSVLGFYLLLAFSPRNFFGAFLRDHLDLNLVFSFQGLVVGSLQAGFQGLPASLAEASYTLGKSSRLHTLFKVLLPNIRPALLAGTVLSFAHTIGEFGVVLMIGGNMPGVTRVVSIAMMMRWKVSTTAPPASTPRRCWS